MPRFTRSVALAALAFASAGGCYHYTFEQTTSASHATPTALRYTIRRPTYLNGFVGNGRVEVQRYCANPARTALRVRANDVAIATSTLLIYTPHTLTVECPVARGGGPNLP